jgi:putative Mn2+ efflux pump MntP
MLALVVMRAALWAMSMLFGGLGIFFLYHSLSNPILSAYALIFIGCASAIVWSLRPRQTRGR